MSGNFFIHSGAKNINYRKTTDLAFTCAPIGLLDVMVSRDRLVVLGVGAVVLDTLIFVDEVPHLPTHNKAIPGEKLPVNRTEMQLLRHLFAEHGKHSIQLGGPVPIALRVYQRAGAEAAFIGAIGHDEVGDELCRSLESWGYRLPFFRQAGVSGQALAFIERSGRRTIIYDKGTLSDVTLEQLDRYRRRLDFPTRIDLIHCDAREPWLPLYLAGFESQSFDLESYMDTGSCRTYLDLDTGDFAFLADEQELSILDLLPGIDYVQLPKRAALEIFKIASIRKSIHYDNEEILRLPLDQLASQILGFLQDADVYSFPANVSRERTVIVTDGAKGSAFAELRNGVVSQKYVPAYVGKVPGHPHRVIDETGAGDVFAGAMGVAILRGRPLLEAMRISSLVAASLTRHPGNQTFLSYDEAAAILSLPGGGSEQD